MIVLVGFMGAGKTSVGRALAERVGLPFVDVDEAIESSEGMSVTRIFETRGEAGFRALERSAVRRVAGGDEAVVALGGGAVEAEENRALLDGATVVYLEIDADEALRRIRDPAARPMLELHDASELLARRRPLYESVADVTVAVPGRSPDDVADEIVTLLAAAEASPR